MQTTINTTRSISKATPKPLKYHSGNQTNVNDQTRTYYETHLIPHLEKTTPLVPWDDPDPWVKETMAKELGQVEEILHQRTSNDLVLREHVYEAYQPDDNLTRYCMA